MKRSTMMIGAALLATVMLFSVAGSAHAQAVKKSALTGVLMSKSGPVPDDSTPHTVFTVPATGFFILTQVCATTPGVGNVTFNAPGVGVLATSTKDECTTFTQGIAVSAGGAITCLNGGTGATEQCLITGVLSSK